MEISTRKPSVNDAKDIFKLIKNSPPLDLNSQYLYLLQTTHFSEYCSVAIYDSKIIGFMSAYTLPKKSDILFVWQIAVDSEFRGMGIANSLLDDILSRDVDKKINYINSTVSPSNKSSDRFFRKYAQKLQTKIEIEEFFDKSCFDEGHEEEPLYVIGPIKNK